MFNRTRSYSAWAVVMAVLFVGCSKSPTEPPVTDLCPGVPGVQTSLPCEVPVYKLIVTIEEPKIGTTVVRGQSLICKASVKEENAQAGSTLTSLWRIDGKIVDCQTVSTDKGPELVSGPASPATMGLSLGSHVVSVEYCNSANGECRLASSEVVVTAPPDMIIFTKVEATYPNDGPSDVWAVNDLPGFTPFRLTNTGTTGIKRAMAMSPDGKFLVYAWNDLLWRDNLDGSAPQQYNLMWEGAQVRPWSVKFSPDGTKLAMIATIAPSAKASAFVMNVDGGQLKRLAGKTLGLDIAWMPDNRRVVLVYGEEGEVGGVHQNVRSTYFTLDVETDQETVFYVANYGEPGQNAILRDVSPNGWMLVWSLFSTRQAIIIRTDGSGEVRVLTAEGGNAANPVFCGQGSYVCAMSGPGDAFRVDLLGQNREAMFTTDGWVIDLNHLTRSR